jgi:hypothetical protein
MTCGVLDAEGEMLLFLQNITICSRDLVGHPHLHAVRYFDPVSDVLGVGGGMQ